MVSTVASQQEGPGLDPGSGRFCVEFACSPCACVGSLWLLQLPPKVQKHAKLRVRLTGHSKFPVSVNVCVDGCLFIHVNPAIKWRKYPRRPRLRLKMLR